jgi:hypothetical protein
MTRTLLSLHQKWKGLIHEKTGFKNPLTLSRFICSPELYLVLPLVYVCTVIFITLGTVDEPVQESSYLYNWQWEIPAMFTVFRESIYNYYFAQPKIFVMLVPCCICIYYLLFTIFVFAVLNYYVLYRSERFLDSRGQLKKEPDYFFPFSTGK